jgi:hypothetical protein
MTTPDLSLVDPLVCINGEVDGRISSRLMAAYPLDDEHIIHVSRQEQTGHRMTWHYVLERGETVIFEGADFSTTAGTTYGEAARGILGLLTLGEHDTDSEYFDGYTPVQIAWRDECAEQLALFAMEAE